MLDELETIWLAGYLEGEGSFTFCGLGGGDRTPTIEVKATDRDVIERVAEAFGVSVVSVSAGKVGWKPQFRARLRGKRAVLLARHLYPHMGVRRRSQMDKLFV